MAEPQKFLPLKPDQIEMAFNPIHRNPVSAVAWVEGKNERIRCKIVKYMETQGNYFITLATVTDTLDFVKQLENEMVDHCLFNVNMPGDNLFFKASLRPTRNEEVNFRIVEEVYKVQRRLHPRLPTDNLGIKVNIQISPTDAGRAQGDMLDISVGGIAIKAPDKHLNILEIGNTLHEVEFTIKEQTVRCSAQLRFKKPIKYTDTQTFSQLKLGLQFQGLRDPDREMIEAFVFEGSSKYFGRKG